MPSRPVVEPEHKSQSRHMYINLNGNKGEESEEEEWRSDRSRWDGRQRGRSCFTNTGYTAAYQYIKKPHLDHLGRIQNGLKINIPLGSFTLPMVSLQFVASRAFLFWLSLFFLLSNNNDNNTTENIILAFFFTTCTLIESSSHWDLDYTVWMNKNLNANINCRPSPTVPICHPTLLVFLGFFRWRPLHLK